jgi:hypothetical protein
MVKCAWQGGQDGRTAEGQKAPQVKFGILKCYTKIGSGEYRKFL